jgi:hypothetical protein
MRNGAMMAALAGVLAMLAAAPAVAGEDRLMDAGDAVPGHPGMTYEDLVRLAVPDLALSPDDHRVEGHLAARPRHLAGPEFQDDDPADLAVELGSVEDKRILVGGKKRIALLADLGGHEGRVEGTALLILLNDEGPTPKLVDMADVAIDKDTVFAEQAVLPLAAGDVALVTWSEHDDADLTLGGYMLISPIGDRLAMVARIALTSENLCSWHGIESVRFATTPDPASPYSRILATAKAVFTGTNEDGCNDEKHPKGTHVFRAAWRWSPVSQRYEISGSTLGGLDALNNKLFGG